jgi:hypothetical protein
MREHSRADPLSTGVAITTYSESNVSRYENLGFRVTGHARHESTPVWALSQPTETRVAAPVSLKRGTSPGRFGDPGGIRTRVSGPPRAFFSDDRKFGDV